jgi:hypothetical protein
MSDEEYERIDAADAEQDMAYDCLNCGQCEWCIERSIDAAEEMESAAVGLAAARYKADAYDDHATVTLFNFSRQKMNDACELAGAYLRGQP